MIEIMIEQADSVTKDTHTLTLLYNYLIESAESSKEKSPFLKISAILRKNAANYEWSIGQGVTNGLIEFSLQTIHYSSDFFDGINFDIFQRKIEALNRSKYLYFF